jgi:hypothetical protein
MYSNWNSNPLINKIKHCQNNSQKSCVSYNGFCPDVGIMVNYGGQVETLIPPFSNMVLTSGCNGSINWARFCDMAGLANSPSCMANGFGGVVARIPSLGCDNCLQVLQPSSNQVLTSDSNGVMYWASICSFGGMNNIITNTLPGGAGLVVNLGSNAPNCLAKLMSSSPNRVLITNSLGAIEFATTFPHVLGSHSDTLFTTLLEGQTIRYQSGMWRNVPYFPSQYINVTQNAALPTSYTLSTLNANYDFNINGVSSFSIVIPDVDALNDGNFLTIRSSNDNGVALVITTTSAQNIGSYSSYTLLSRGQSITLGANFTSLSWIIIGSNDHVGEPHHTSVFDQNTTLVSVTGTNNAILRWDTTQFLDPSGDVSYNAATGELTFLRGGVYTIDAERYFNYDFTQLGTVEFDMVFVHASVSGALLTDPLFSSRIDLRGTAQSYVINNVSNNVSSGLLKLSSTINIGVPFVVYGFVVRVVASNIANVINFNPLGLLTPIGSSGSFKVTRLT